MPFQVEPKDFTTDGGQACEENEERGAGLRYRHFAVSVAPRQGDAKELWCPAGTTNHESIGSGGRFHGLSAGRRIKWKFLEGSRGETSLKQLPFGGLHVNSYQRADAFMKSAHRAVNRRWNEMNFQLPVES
jgi:hypothetical protein